MLFLTRQAHALPRGGRGTPGHGRGVREGGPRPTGLQPGPEGPRALPRPRVGSRSSPRAADLQCSRAGAWGRAGQGPALELQPPPSLAARWPQETGSPTRPPGTAEGPGPRSCRASGRHRRGSRGGSGEALDPHSGWPGAESLESLSAGGAQSPQHQCGFRWAPGRGLALEPGPLL